MKLYEMIFEMPMFKNFSEREKKKFAKIEHPFLEFNRGEIIIKEGELSTELYLLVKGTALVTKIEDGVSIRLAKLKSGDIFGEMAYYQKKPRRTNVIANESVMVLQLDDQFFKKAGSDTKVKIKDYLIELLCNRLDSMNSSIMKISKVLRS